MIKKRLEIFFSNHNGAHRCTSKSDNCIPSIDPSTKFLSIRALFWMIRNDTEFHLLKKLFRHPFRHGMRYVCSFFSTKKERVLDEYTLCNLDSLESFFSNLNNPEIILLIGFSYCQKPLNCPEKRFTKRCSVDKKNPTCQTCFIGKSSQAFPHHENIVFSIITTANDIGKTILDIMENYPHKKVLFLITTCHMAITLFSPFGYMVNASGIALPFQHHFCNTWKAFMLSEEGKKRGITALSQGSEEIFSQILSKIQPVE